MDRIGHKTAMNKSILFSLFLQESQSGGDPGPGVSGSHAPATGPGAEPQLADRHHSWRLPGQQLPAETVSLTHRFPPTPTNSLASPTETRPHGC